jgi:transposase
MLKETLDGRKLTREVQEAYRLRAIELRNYSHYTVKQISEIFGIHYNSVSRWFCKVRRGGNKALLQRKAPGAEPLLDKGHLKWLEKALAREALDFGFSTPLWTGTLVRILLKQERGVLLDRVTVWRYLIRLGLSFQKPEKRYSQQDKKLVEEWIKKEWPAIQLWAKRNKAILYFEDESGVSLSPVIGKTWAPKGKPPIVRVTGKRGGVLAMSAISPSGRMCFKLQKGKINSEVMLKFLRQIGFNHKGRKVGVIMDQAPCHSSEKIRSFSENSKQIKIFYIPPYSPDLNPDEKVWRHLKHVSLKNHQAQDKVQLTRLVLGALRQMQKNPKLIENFFANYLT